MVLFKMMLIKSQFRRFQDLFKTLQCYFHETFALFSRPGQKNILFCRSDTCPSYLIVSAWNTGLKNNIILDGINRIQEYVARDASNIGRVDDKGNIVSIEGNIFLYPKWPSSNIIIIFIRLYL